MIDDITIDFWFFGNFTSIKDIRKKWNPMFDLSIFTSNIKNISEVITIDYNQVCSKTFSKILASFFNQKSFFFLINTILQVGDNSCNSKAVIHGSKAT